MTDKLKWIGGVLLFVMAFVAGWAANGWRIGSEVDRLKAQYATALQQSEQEARAKERALRADHDENQKKHEKEMQNAKMEMDKLRARIHRGAVRLSVPASACTVSDNPGTGDRETRAELDPTTADDLVAIAADGDNAVRELNLCIDQYNAVAANLNSPE